MNIIKECAKAITALVMAYAVSQLIKKGVTLDAVTQAQLSSLVEAGIVALAVWLVPNKQKVVK